MKNTYVKLVVTSLLTLTVSLSIMSVAHANWSTVGGAGTIDESRLDLYAIDSLTGDLYFGFGKAGIIGVKYNVTEGNLIGTDASLFVRFRDNGASSRIVVDLKRYGLTNGVLSTIATFDSNTFSANSSWQTQQECFIHTFDFENYAYFINARLTRSSTSGTTGLAAISIAGCQQQ